MLDRDLEPDVTFESDYEVDYDDNDDEDPSEDELNKAQAHYEYYFFKEHLLRWRD